MWNKLSGSSGATLCVSFLFRILLLNLLAIPSITEAMVTSNYLASTNALEVLADADGDTVTVSHDGANVLVNGATVANGIGSVRLDDLSGGISILGDSDPDDNVFVVDDAGGSFERTGGTPISFDLDGGGGDDILIGAGGDEDLAGGLGNDLLIGGDGNDLLSGALDNDILDGGPGADTLTGAEGNNLLFGSSGGDTFNTDGGSNEVDGEAGAETLTFAEASQGVTVDLDLIGTPQSTLKADLVLTLLSPIENFVGSASDDQVFVDPQPFPRNLDGGDGTDTLSHDPLGQVFSDDGAVILTSGFGDIAYVNFETIVREGNPLFPNLVTDGTGNALDLMLFLQDRKGVPPGLDTDFDGADGEDPKDLFSITFGWFQ